MSSSASGSGSSRSTARASPSSSRSRSSSSDGGGSTPTPSRARLELPQWDGRRGAARRRTSGRSPGSPRVGSPARVRRARRTTSPTRTDRRRTGTAAAPVSATRSTSRRVSSSRPKKSALSASRNARRPLYGLRSSPGIRTRALVPSTAPRNAAQSSSTSPKRACGSLAVARAIAASTAGGTSGRLSRTEGIGWWRCWSSRTFSDVPGKGCSRGQHLVQHDPEGVDVRTRGRLLEPDLLGGQVRGRSADHRPGGLLGRAGLQRDAEVGQVGVAFLVQQDVAGLHVTVHHPLVVCGRRAPRRSDRGSGPRVRARGVRRGGGPRGSRRAGTA